MLSTDEQKTVFTLAVDIGTQMLCCGAEIHRVEDTISRMLAAEGATRIEVFSIISGIMVTAFWDGVQETQTRRVHSSTYDMAQLVELNELSRELCEGGITAEQAQARLEQLRKTPQYGAAAGCGIYALISCAFSIFFGGSILDAVISAAIGVLIFGLRKFLLHRGISGIMCVLILSLLGGIAAHGAAAIGLPCAPRHIAIGNIMLLVPGISLTNAIRDMFSGDTISGSLRFVESMLIAITLACGFALPALLF